METPQVIILPQTQGANPAKVVDFGSAGLERVLEYCNRMLQWPKVHLPLVDSQKPVPIGELQESVIRRASFDYHSPIPEGITVRRVVMGTAVVAIYSKEDGTIVGNAIEAVKITPELESLIDEIDDEDEDEYEYDEEEYEDDEEEYEDDEEEYEDDEDFDGDVLDDDEDLEPDSEDEDLEPDSEDEDLEPDSEDEDLDPDDEEPEPETDPDSGDEEPESVTEASEPDDEGTEKQA